MSQSQSDAGPIGDEAVVIGASELRYGEPLERYNHKRIDSLAVSDYYRSLWRFRRSGQEIYLSGPLCLARSRITTQE